MVINEIKTENVDILYTSPDNLNIKTDLIQNKYDAAFVLYGSEQLLGNLKSQFENQLTQIESPELQSSLANKECILLVIQKSKMKPKNKLCQRFTDSMY